MTKDSASIFRPLRPLGRSLLWALLLVPLGCADSASVPGGGVLTERPAGRHEGQCSPSQSAPYADGIPYVGIHGNAGNDDFVDCRTPDAWRRDWHGLAGLGMTQPNTFSPDGRVTYVTTTNPRPDGCRLHAVDTHTGQATWCRSYATGIERGSVEVDARGHLYFTVDDAVISLDALGSPRWQTALRDPDGGESTNWGLHFTPDGHIATVSAAGTVSLLRRSDGRLLASLHIPSTWGFVPPVAFDAGVDPSELLPESVQRDIQTVWGAPSEEDQEYAFGALLGSGSFVDNTVAVSDAGDIYIIGGGPDQDRGALVQVRVTGSAEAPVLEAGWHAVTHGSSATTPSISPGDGYVVIGDGASPQTFFAPDSVDGSIKAYDIGLCDSNQDVDPDPSVCGLAWQESLERAPMVGAPAVLEDGTVIFWEMDLSFRAGPTTRDVVARAPSGVLWETALPDDMDWSSVLTVTQNHVVGSASRVERSNVGLPGFTLPIRTADRLVVLDRFSGELVWYAELPDDCASTVTVGPDGSLYVPMLGLFSILALEDRPTLGLLRFRPADPADTPAPPPLPPAHASLREGDEPEPEQTAAGTETGGAGSEPVPSASDGACFDVALDDLEPCCAEGPAHCAPAELIPERFTEIVSSCEGGGLCVPDSILTAHGQVEMVSCKSVGDAAGACVSLCVPEVAQMAGLLPIDVCAEHEACVPCVSPLDGEDTGVCDVLVCQPGLDEAEGDDTGPKGESDADDPPAAQESEEQEAPPSCCAGWGTCLAAAIVPEAERRNVKTCAEQGEEALLCVPNEFLDPSWVPGPCQGRGLLGRDYEGVCLPDCLKLPFEFALDALACEDGYVCAPCTDGITGAPTGAPGC